MTPYPPPLNHILQKEYTEKDFGSLRPDIPWRPFQPVLSLRKDENVALLFDRGGKDNKVQLIATLIGQLRKARPKDDLEPSFYPDNSPPPRFHYAYIFDADEPPEGGLEKNMRAFKDDFRETFVDMDSLEVNQSIETITKERLGCWFFMRPGETVGTLEDLVESLIHEKHMPLFQAVENFIDGQEENYPFGNRSHRKKAVITTAGQMTGAYASSLSIVLSRSDLIDRARRMRRG